MKKFGLFMLALALSVVLCGSAMAAERKQIRVGMECDYAPDNWQESEPTELNVPIENLPGFYADGNDVQISRIIADKLGVELAIVKLTWSGLIESLNNGQIDMIIAGMSDTPERWESINFSNPYKTTTYGMMVKANSKYANATSIQDFAGASVLGQKDTLLDTVIDQIEGVNHLPAVEAVPNQLARLMMGTCDAITVELENAPVYLDANPGTIAITFPEGKGFTLDFKGICVGLRKSDTELLAQVNEILDTISPEQRTEMFNAAVERQPK